MSQGRLIGVGVGPGDPELLTIKAVRVLRAAPVVAYFAKAGRRGNARKIVDPWLTPANEELPLAYPVTTEIPVSDPEYRAALDLWGDRLGGALVAIGNAPTALFRLLEMIAAGAPKPAAILGMPVGFVGAAESKEALLASGLPAIVVRGRKGGSAMAAAAVNALGSERE